MLANHTCQTSEDAAIDLPRIDIDADPLDAYKVIMPDI